MDKPQRVLRLVISEVKPIETRNGTVKLVFSTSRGFLSGLIQEVDNPVSGVIMVGGVGGGFEGPAGGMYPEIAAQIAPMGIVTLRLDYRVPTNLEECILDVMAGIAYLEDLGIHDIALVGHSLGGAVVIEAGANSDSVKTVVTISSQTRGTSSVSKLAPRSLLLIHGTSDAVLSSSCSEDIFKRATEPKELLLVPGDDHVLSNSKEQVKDKVTDWLLTHLPVNPDLSN